MLFLYCIFIDQIKKSDLLLFNNGLGLINDYGFLGSNLSPMKLEHTCAY